LQKNSLWELGHAARQGPSLLRHTWGGKEKTEHEGADKTNSEKEGDNKKWGIKRQMRALGWGKRSGEKVKREGIWGGEMAGECFEGGEDDGGGRRGCENWGIRE